jgi:hypothetical protein
LISPSTRAPVIGTMGGTAGGVYLHQQRLGTAVGSAPVAHRSVWTSKGFTAPSAADLVRRPGVMDLMGISRQLNFPGFGLNAFVNAGLKKYSAGVDNVRHGDWRRR